MGRYWSEEIVLLLIRTMKTHEHIWNPQHPGYTRNKLTRHDSWKEITAAFNKLRPDLEFKSAELCSKWNNLRLCFQKEAKKKSELGMKTSRWKYYKLMRFLATDRPKKEEESASSETEAHTFRETKFKLEAIDGMEEATSPWQAQINHSNIDSFSAGTCTVIPASSLGQTEMGRAFGEYVAAEIRQLEPDLQMRAKQGIFNLLMELQREQELRRCSSRTK